MHRFLSELLSDKKGGVVFSCFGVWHLLYMLVIFGVILSLLFLLRKKRAGAKQRAVRISIGCAFVCYIADFFLMPFAYGAIDLEKLPFHACTATCILCFLSQHNRFWGRFKSQFALLGLISNLIYVVYPAGVGWYQIHPLSYRALQTLLFHGLMTAYGLFFLVFGETKPTFRTCYKDLLLLVAMTLWALFGNTLYNGTYGETYRRFNWFFVTADPFGILPTTIAPYVMPFIMILFLFALELPVFAAASFTERAGKRKGIGK